MVEGTEIRLVLVLGKSAIQAKAWIADISLYRFSRQVFKILCIMYLCKIRNDMVSLTLHSNTESFIGDIKRLVEQGRNAA